VVGAGYSGSSEIVLKVDNFQMLLWITYVIFIGQLVKQDEMDRRKM
jgi:hypothetical protein